MLLPAPFPDVSAAPFLAKPFRAEPARRARPAPRVPSPSQPRQVVRCAVPCPRLPASRLLLATRKNPFPRGTNMHGLWYPYCYLHSRRDSAKVPVAAGKAGVDASGARPCALRGVHLHSAMLSKVASSNVGSAGASASQTSGGFPGEGGPVPCSPQPEPAAHPRAGRFALSLVVL